MERALESALTEVTELEDALASGLVLRSYWAEYLFGFVVGMAFVFGSVLPTLIGSVAVSISAIAHLVIRPGFAWTLRRALA